MEFNDIVGDEIDQPLETLRDFEVNSNNPNIEGSTNNTFIDNDLKSDSGENKDNDDDKIGLG